MKYLYLIIFVSLICLSKENQKTSNHTDKLSLETQFEYPYAIKHFQKRPPQFTKSDLDPAKAITAQLCVPFENPIHNYWLLGRLLFMPQITMKPAFGFGGGYKYQNAPFMISAGLVFAFFNKISKEPLDKSQFNTYYYSYPIELKIFTNFIELGLEYVALNIADSELNKYEDIKTEISHKGSNLYSGNIKLKLLNLYLKAVYDIIQLGETAIASKNFAFGFKEDTVFRSEFTAGIHIKTFDIFCAWAKLYGIRDELEHYYLAPYYYNRFMLAPEIITVGLKWIF